MNGHKWECFVFELSFLGWSMLGAVTMGLSQVLYSNPYRVASFTEYYVALRKMAKERNIPEAQQLNDIYLYRPAGREALDLAYADVIAVMKKPKKEIDDLKGPAKSGRREVLPQPPGSDSRDGEAAEGRNSSLYASLYGVVPDTIILYIFLYRMGMGSKSSSGK